MAIGIHTISEARPLPPTLHIDGDAPVDGNDDWFILGALPNGGDLSFRTTGAVNRIIVSDGVTDYEGTLADDGSDRITGLPATTPLWLRIVAIGPYALDVEPGTTGMPAAVAAIVPPDVTLSLATDRPAVAAYWAAGQAVGGTLTVSNTGRTASRYASDGPAEFAT